MFLRNILTFQNINGRPKCFIGCSFHTTVQCFFSELRPEHGVKRRNLFQNDVVNLFEIYTKTIISSGHKINEKYKKKERKLF